MLVEASGVKPNPSFMNKLLTVVFSFYSLIALAQSTKPVLVGGCEGCDLMFAGMPKNLSSSTRIAATQGEPMRISGTIFQADGKTPASNVVLYVYHTDAKGYYTPGTGQTEARQHGQLRGWMKTDAQGRYEFSSIKPAPYPGDQIPAHIHPIVLEPNGKHYWLEDYFFEDDRIVTANMRANKNPRGGRGILSLTKDAQGVWVGQRDLVLGLHVPGY